ncbi:MAG: response regulator [Candidatus Aminicenantales bacterium]
MGRRNPKILIVEDENIIALDIRSMLEDLGYMVSGVVSSGEESIEKASQMKPDLILMDIKLKGTIDGVRAGEEIHKQFRIPVIYLTAYSDKATLSRINNNGFKTVLHKPFDEGELQSVIHDTLGHQKSLFN